MCENMLHLYRELLLLRLFTYVTQTESALTLLGETDAPHAVFCKHTQYCVHVIHQNHLCFSSSSLLFNGYVQSVQAKQCNVLYACICRALQHQAIVTGQQVLHAKYTHLSMGVYLQGVAGSLWSAYNWSQGTTSGFTSDCMYM